MIKTKEQLEEYHKADLAAHGKARFGLWDYLTNDILRFQRRMRITEYYSVQPGWWNRLRYYLNFGIYLRQSKKLGFTIPINVIGKGLCIVHYGTIVISPKARIGEFFRVHPGTCVGEYHGAPQIGDYVYLGPGAKVFGQIDIGNFVSIGANAVVQKSVDSCSVVVGVPARSVAHGRSVDLGLYPITLSGWSNDSCD